MAVRTTSAAVEGLTEVDSTVSLTPFILTANVMVTKFCTGDNGPTDPEYTDDELELIERWLAAHYYRMRDLQPIVERAGTVAEHRKFIQNTGLDNTTYGQTAMTLDWNGGLAAWQDRVRNGRTKRVSISWLGTSPEPDYDDWSIG